MVGEQQEGTKWAHSGLSDVVLSLSFFNLNWRLLTVKRTKSCFSLCSGQSRPVGERQILWAVIPSMVRLWGDAGAGMRAGLCPDQPLCPAQLPLSLSTAGPAGPCPLARRISGAVVNVSPCWSSVWGPCSARSRGSPAQPSPSAHPANTVLTRAHGPAASAGSFWAQHNVLAFLLLLLSHDAKGSPSSCTQLCSQAGPSFQSLLLLEHWAQLGITLLHQAPHSREHPCPEPSALLLFPRPVPPRFSSCCPRKGSWAGIPWQGLLPPTAEGASNIKGVLGQCPHPWEPHNEAQKNVLGFKDFYLIFFVCFY